MPTGEARGVARHTHQDHLLQIHPALATPGRENTRPELILMGVGANGGLVDGKDKGSKPTNHINPRKPRSYVTCQVLTLPPLDAEGVDRWWEDQAE